jgi:hypothetical protein
VNYELSSTALGVELYSVVEQGISILGVVDLVEDKAFRET